MIGLLREIERFLLELGLASFVEREAHHADGDDYCINLFFTTAGRDGWS
jgi:hypothetical protein